MRKNNEIKKIIDYIKKTNPKIQNIANSLSFNSKENCKNKILILVNIKNNNLYNYINEGIQNGAIGLITSNTIQKNRLKKQISYLRSCFLQKNLNIFLDHIYNQPLKNKLVIGITGTDGKTSTSYSLAKGYQLIGKKVGLISSEGNGVFPRLARSSYTTPRNDILFELFNKFNNANVDIIIIECSSQGLQQGRVDCIKFNTSIVTNINKDHIEYHKNFTNYVKSKAKLLEMTNGKIFLNQTCNNSQLLLRYIKRSQIIYYNTFNYNQSLFEPPYGLIDNFFRTQGINKKLQLKIHNNLGQIPGRANIIKGKDNIMFIIDYAHTISSFERIIKISKKELNCKLLATVFGCGGDRDKNKRLQFGRIADKYSDKIILTDDNPRSENSLQILKDIKKGIKNKSKAEIIIKRKSAIKQAVRLAREGYLILLLGKGNENEIIYKKRIVKHNDIKYVKMLLK